MSISSNAKPLVPATVTSTILWMWLFVWQTAWSSPVDAFTPFSTAPTFRHTAFAVPLLFQSEDETNSLLTPYSDRDRMPEQYQYQPTAEAVRREWVDKSISYYSKVMREERRRNLGQISEEELKSEVYHEEFALMAKKHYFALRKAKDGQPKHAELIYQKIIHELLSENEEEECDHAKLAITTLLLALHVQRSGGDAKKTRSIFLRFFRLVNQRSERCACSAKVLIAFALFEMKQGNALKSLYIVLKAIKLDPSVRPILNWKQFRDSMQRRRQLQQQSREHRRLLKQRLFVEQIAFSSDQDCNAAPCAA